jgi:thioredoxin-like negative regulator of GroEL
MTSDRATPALEIANIRNLESALSERPALLLYVKTPECGICHALWPKLESQLGAAYPHLTLARIDAVASPDVAAALAVHRVPTVLLFFEGREHHRFSHAFGINEIGAAIDRPYHLLFTDDTSQV